MTPDPHHSVKSICVFCGSSAGSLPAYAAAASQLGVELARRSIAVVYGGGNVGLMGLLADATLAAGGRVIGVMPRHLVEREIAHGALSELQVVETMHQRKRRMMDLGDAFILMPGGFGSWEEFCEVVTWSQLGLHRKAFGILNVDDYYGPLLSMTERAVDHGFVRATHGEAIIVATHPADLIDRLINVPGPREVKWERRTEK